MKCEKCGYDDLGTGDSAHVCLRRHDVVFENTGYVPEPLYTHPADCPRCAELAEGNSKLCRTMDYLCDQLAALEAKCAELEATNRQLNREILSVGDEAEDYAMKLSALETEKRDLVKRNYLTHELYETGDEGCPDQAKDRNGEVVLGVCKNCGRAEAELAEPCDHRKQLAALEAEVKRQAERIRVLEEEDTETHLMKDKTIVMQGDELAQQAEQLAAAEKVMNRCYKMLLSEPDTKGALFKAENILREALADAAIAASREGKS